MLKTVALTLILSLAPMVVMAETPKAPAAKPEMSKLSPMTGVWKGRAKGTDRAGKAYDIIQTERVGFMLDGDVLVVEGKGYEDGGAVAFNALGVVSYNAMTQKYEFRAYSGGFAGTHSFEVTPEGFVWEMAAGPKAKIRYLIVIKDGTWVETGEYIAEGQPGRKFIELNLKRVGDSDWPVAGTIKP
ncbi:DUF1579 domain-containing protein [Asticcacaulis sp. BYS171W]|uniref:DUF1579 domain-containing protein n=1 Tax=Asticcacaulis aquaticus TaxID=2984212 RepID=A0ABT5HPU6_9CAUL|nr:DUF1579 domain-containing protein [Asticcacaulis aquaticus]MDC7682084.1 DUF1579 domain-containing protein [Asticcacaulis aquaticus]